MTQDTELVRGRAVRLLLLQEAFYIGCCLLIGTIIVLANDWTKGFKAAFLCFVILQAVMIWVNRGVIRAMWR